MSPSTDRTVHSVLLRTRYLWAAAGAGYLLLFWPTLTTFAYDCWETPDYSHCLAIPAICLGIVLANRRELGAVESRRSLIGFAVLVVALLVFFAGYGAGRTNVIERIGLWVSLVAGVWFVFGSKLIVAKPFPFFYLLLAIPPPFVIFDSLRLELQRIATRISGDVLRLSGFDVIVRGNVLQVESELLEVADACSGIRSLFAIVATSVLFAYLFRTGIYKGALIVVTSIPITVAINVLRILIVSVALASFDVDLTEGLIHDGLGLGVFAISLGLLYLSWLLYDWLFPARQRTTAPTPMPTPAEQTPETI